MGDFAWNNNINTEYRIQPLRHGDSKLLFHIALFKSFQDHVSNEPIGTNWMTTEILSVSLSIDIVRWYSSRAIELT